ncbi:hypothetical protein GALL_477370 [mine drainage metagenome]|uniref:Uncharacterized protein n=1 Tax=mine drainage metagenome TaxID=410659 RepID=A0A1J5PSD3_9ZZZZ
MRNKVDDIQPCYPLLVQVIHGMRIFFAKNCHQHIGPDHFFFTTAGGLHVHDGTLNHALKTQRWLGIDILHTRHLRRIVLDENRQGFAQIIKIGRTGTQHLGRAGVVQQGQHQMLNRDEFVTLLTCLNKRHMKTDFQFLGNHGVPLIALFQALTVIGIGVHRAAARIQFLKAQRIQKSIATDARPGVPHQAPG